MHKSLNCVCVVIANFLSHSFSGYAAAIVAGLWPSLAKSVVLMNSAGNIIPGYRPLGYSEVRNAETYD